MNQPETTKSHSLAEAVTELFKHEPGRVEFTQNQESRTLVLRLNELGSIECREFAKEDSIGSSKSWIPEGEWFPREGKPKGVHKTSTITSVSVNLPGIIKDLESDVERIRSKWSGAIELSYSIRAAE